MNNLHSKLYNYIKRNFKNQPRHVLANAIFASSFSSSAVEMMAHYSPHTCLKNSACLIIVYSLQFFSSLSWQVFEYFLWIFRKDFYSIIGCQCSFQFPKTVNQGKKTTTKHQRTSKQIITEQLSSILEFGQREILNLHVFFLFGKIMFPYGKSLSIFNHL